MELSFFKFIFGFIPFLVNGGFTLSESFDVNFWTRPEKVYMRAHEVKLFEPTILKISVVSS